MNKNRRKEFIPNFRRAFIQAIINRFFATFSCQELLSQASVLQIKKNQGHTKGLSFIIHASFFFFCLFCDKYQGVFLDLSQKGASVATS